MIDLGVAPFPVCEVKNVRHLGSIQERSSAAAWPRNRPMRAVARSKLALSAFVPEVTPLVSFRGLEVRYLRALGGDVWVLDLEGHDGH